MSKLGSTITNKPTILE